jgi:hypothetical protein
MRIELSTVDSYRLHLLDCGVIGASRELAIDEDARGEADLALEGLIVELV